MSKYSIKDLEKITGVKAHTIRIWERRYNIIQPERTETNIRLYSDADLKRLLNISMLNSSGIKISKLAKLSGIDIEAKVIELTRNETKGGFYIEKLTMATLNFNEELFEKILSKSVLESGMEDTITKILFPFFERVGVLWQVGSISPAQEHFISNLIRQKLFAAIDAYSGSKSPHALKALLYLKEDELHEVGILFYNYILKKNGFKTLYLGQDLPYENLVETVSEYQPNILLTSFISPIHTDELNLYLKILSDSFSDINILVMGLQLKQNEIKVPSNLNVVSSVERFKEILKMPF